MATHVIIWLTMSASTRPGGTITEAEAKAHFAALLVRVEKGEEFTITRHGQPVARFTSLEPRDQAAVGRAIDGIGRLRRSSRSSGRKTK